MDGVPTITPAAIPPGRRRNTLASTRLLSEWLALYHHDDPAWYQLRLGPISGKVLNVAITPQIERMLSRSNMYADAVVATPGQLLVVEAKVIPPPGAISQVMTYALLATGTRELKPYLDRPIVSVILAAVDNDVVRQVAASHGVQLIVYTPRWIEEYLRSKYYHLPPLPSAS